MTTTGTDARPAVAPGGRRAGDEGGGPIVYLAQKLPSRSQTFVYQEILALRARGASVRPVSVRRNLFMAEIEARLGGVESLLGSGFARHLAAGLALSPRRLAGVVRDLARGPFPSRGQALRTGAHAVMGVALAGRLRRVRPAYLHAHHAEMSTTVAMVAGRLMGIPFGFTAHGSDVHSHPLLLARKMASASVVVAASDFIRESLLEVSPAADVRVVRCPVPLDRFRPPGDRAPGSRLRLLHVGRLDGVKDQATLVEAAARAVAGGTDLELTIVGDGPLRGELERLVAERGLQERVRLLGAMDNDDLPGLYRAADAFVMSSRREGLPVVLVEALASGLPVVATDVGGISELVRDGLDGFLVPPEDPAELARAIAQMEDPAVRRVLGSNGVERARVHDLDTVARTLLDLFPVPLPAPADAATGRAGGAPGAPPGAAPPIGPPLPVSVLVPARGDGDGLLRSLRSIAGQRPRTAGEVLVIGPDSVRAVALDAGARHVAAPGGADDATLLARGATECGEEWIAVAREGAEWLPGHLATLWEHRHGRMAVAGTAVEPGAAVAPWPARRVAAGLSGPLRRRPDAMPPLAAALVRRGVVLEAAVGGALTEDAVWSAASRAGVVGLVPTPVVRIASGGAPARPGWRRPRRASGDGGPSVALLPSALSGRAAAERLMAGRALLDLSAARRPLMQLALRPTTAAFVGTTREALVLRALGIRPLRSERGEDQTMRPGPARAPEAAL